MNPYLHKVQYYETDKMGITHHSNYVRWMEEARVDFLSQIGWDYARIEESGIISPVLNAFVSTTSRKTFKDVLIAFFFIQTICGFYSQYDFFNSGYSPLSFIGLYLLARYMKLYSDGFCTLKKRYDVAIYLCTVLFTSLLAMKFGRAGYDSKALYDYLAPAVIIGSVYFFLFFTIPWKD